VQVNKIFKISNLLTTPVISDISAGCTGILWSTVSSLATNQAGTMVWACFDGLWQVSSKVCRYENGTWTNYGDGLPNIPANSIEYLNNSDDVLFLGMDDGVYYRNKFMTEWKEFRCGLPFTMVTSLRINYATKKLRAGTYGRGIWETSISQKTNSLTCSNAVTATAAIGGQPFPVNISNGATVPVLAPQTSVTLNLTNYCNGAINCGASQVSWKIFWEGALVQTGNGPSISFNGIFKTGMWWWTARHTYRVEVSTACGTTSCPPLIYYFRGQ
jgi:hypothetical protein